MVPGFRSPPAFVEATKSTALEPQNMWRDTVFIPPWGSTIIWQRFGITLSNAWEGKTVFHCHFLDHEDQGMMAAFLIGDPKPNGPLS